MSRVSKVEVLCPNGHRVTVNVGPKTKFLQIVEECCLKQRLGPASGFGLKFRHNQKRVDLSLSVQLAGLMNMAKLDLVEITNQKASTKARVAVQLDGGGRFQQEFDPVTSLWSILESFQCDSGSGTQVDFSRFCTVNEQPIISYLDEEIVGEYALKSTTLKMLGILEGRHLLRLSFKVIGDERLEEVRRKIDKEKERLSRMAAKAGCLEGVSENASAGMPHLEKSVNSEPAPSSEISNTLSGDVNISSTHLENSDCHPTGPAEPMETTDSSSLADEALVVEAAATVGGKTKRDADLPVETSGVTGTELTRFNDAAQTLPPSSNMQGHRQEWDFPVQQNVSIRTQSLSPFAEFKFPEETKGKHVYRNELSDVKKEDFQPCDRKAVLFNLSNMEQVEYETLDDQFFEPTVDDVRVLQASRSREVAILTEQMLMTEAMRIAQRDAKMSRYQRVIIRFQFPDLLVLQAVFRPSETVFALYKFVKENLEQKNLDFELYTTPPKTLLLNKVKNLVEAGLAPMSVVYVSTADQTAGVLATAVLNSISSHSEAKKVLDEFMPARGSSRSQDVVEGSSNNLPEPSRLTSASANMGRSGATAGATASSSNKTPKWFKTGKK